MYGFTIHVLQHFVWIVCTNTCKGTSLFQYFVYHIVLQSFLTKQQNDFKIKLKELEDNLLHRLSSAEGNILKDTALVENLEVTKKTAADIAVQVEQAKTTEEQINKARENYRPAAARASLLYFILNDLYKINPLYQFSLKVCMHELCRWGF